MEKSLTDLFREAANRSVPDEAVELWDIDEDWQPTTNLPTTSQALTTLLSQWQNSTSDMREP